LWRRHPAAPNQPETLVTQPRACLQLEPLEERSLLSLTLTPEYLRVPTFRTRGILVTSMLVSDTPAARTLLPDAANLQVTARAGKVKRLLGPVGGVQSRDVNGDGIPDLIALFRLSQFKGLHAGKVTVTVSDPANPGVTESTTITLRALPGGFY
jgi:hypothetical protein